MDCDGSVEVLSKTRESLYFFQKSGNAAALFHSLLFGNNKFFTIVLVTSKNINVENIFLEEEQSGHTLEDNHLTLIGSANKALNFTILNESFNRHTLYLFTWFIVVLESAHLEARESAIMARTSRLLLVINFRFLCN